MDVCEDWNSSEYSTQEMHDKYGGGYLPRGVACDWVIYGYDVQHSITFDLMLNDLADYVLMLESHIAFLEEMIENIYQASKEAIDKVNEQIGK